MKKKTLIIAYTFPPAKGIGGRRWAKFAKYLSRGGTEIKIITAKTKEFNSGWNSDIIDYENNIEKISFNYPSFLGVIPKTIFDKILYRTSLIWSKFNSKGNYYDKAIHGEKNLLNKVRNCIREGYDNIIVTVAPFHIATYVAKLKNEYPNINFIVDFRDPWIGNETAYGYYSLSEERKQFERTSEMNVINTFDTIITVSKSITEDLKKKYPKSKATFVTIPNGFDYEDIPNNLVQSSNYSDKIRLVFTGTFYNTAEKYLVRFCEWLDELKLMDEDFYNSLIFDFYGNVNIDVNFTKRHQIIRFHGLVSLEKVYGEICDSNGCLLFLTDDINYSFSTKFCEYLAMKKPIFVISNGGYTGEYVENNFIGESLIISDSVFKFKDVLSSLKNGKKKYYKDYSIDVFNIEQIVKEVDKLLN